MYSGKTPESFYSLWHGGHNLNVPIAFILIILLELLQNVGTFKTKYNFLLTGYNFRTHFTWPCFYKPLENTQRNACNSNTSNLIGQILFIAISTLLINCNVIWTKAVSIKHVLFGFYSAQ